MNEPVEQRLIELPKRVSGTHSNKFSSLRVLTNHCYVSVKDIPEIYIYSVKFTPMIPFDNTDLRMKILNQKMSQIKLQIQQPVISGTNIYSTLPPTETQKEYICDEYKVNIKQVKVYNLKDNKKMLLTFLNNGLRNIMRKLDFVQIGRSGKYFNAKQKTKIDDLIMYNGYKSNFVHLQKGFFLRIDPAKKIVRNQTVLQFIDEFYNANRHLDKQQKRLQIKNELVGKIVMSNYGKTRYCKIDDLEFKDIETIMLENQVTLLQYYESKYKITIKSLKQPLIVTEGRNKEKPAYMFPELMLMTGIPENFDQFRRKKISQQTIKNPSDKLDQIQSLIQKLKRAQEIKSFEQIGLKLHRNLQKIEAKQIPTPILELGKKKTVDRGRQAFFQLFSAPIFSAKHDIPCAVIRPKNTDVGQLIQTFKRTSASLEVKLTVSQFTYSNSSVSAIQAQIARAVDRGSKICCIVIPASLKGSYKNIKVSTLKQTIITQIVVETTLRKKGVQSIVTKVLLQIIAKRGNILWVPKLTVDLQFAGMLVGFEQVKIGQKTALTICATINSTFNLVYSASNIYEGPENKYFAMKSLLMKAIGAYSARNKGTPEEIICFFSSCPEDQIRLYHQLFIKDTLEQIKQAYTDSTTVLTVVMINCKTSERFFNKNNGDKPTNVPAGTLVSQQVVSLNYDFYIISQLTRNGTSVPNHYKVIFSNSKLQEGILQEIIFSQCFNYVNWTGSIKVPAILQYAKKASKFKAEIFGEEDIPEELSNRLYFI